RWGHPLHHGLRDSRRLNRADAQAFQAIDTLQGLDNPQQVMALTGIGPDVDPGQHQLTMAARHQPMGLTDDVVELATARTATRERDDAEGTSKIAAILNLEIGPCVPLVEADPLHKKIPTADFLAVHHPWLARLLRHIHQLGDLHLVLSADNQIDAGNAP